MDRVVRPISLNEQDDDRDQTKHATIARLGRIGTSTWRDGSGGPRPADRRGPSCTMPRPTSPRTPPRSSCSAAARSPSKDCCRPGSGRQCYLPLSLPLLGLSCPPARSFCALPSRLSGRPGGSARWLPGESLSSPEPAARDAEGWLLGGLAASTAPRPGPAATAVLVWASSTIRPRAVPMRAPSSAPTTTKSWPRRRSDRSTGPPRSNTTLTTLPEPAEAKRRKLEPALSA